MTHWLAVLANNKSGPDAGSIGELDAYCRVNPYCQVAQMLLAIALKKHGRDPDGNHEKRALAYALDRQVYKIRMKQVMAPSAPAEDQALLSGAGYVLEPVVPTPHIGSIDVAEEDPAEGSGKQDAGSGELSEKQQKQQALIDRFLKSDARIVPGKEGGAPAVSEPEEADEEPEVLSETLAEILARQGKTDKALGIYEKLCLKYPEKSSYFAKKIEYLQNKTD